MSTAEKNRAHNNAIVVLVAWLGFDAHARNGALVGAGLSLVITLPSLIVAYWGVKQSPTLMFGTVLLTWTLKMVVLILILIVLRGEPWLSMPWVGIALLFGAVAPIAVEGVLLARTRPKIEV